MPRGPSARFAGIRTFTLLGIVAGLSGWLSAAGFLPAATVLLAGAVAITVAGYVAASRQDVDGTTEVAALVVLAAGVLAGILPAPDTASPTNPFIASSETGSSRAVHLPRAPIRSSRIGHIRTSPSIWRDASIVTAACESATSCRFADTKQYVTPTLVVVSAVVSIGSPCERYPRGLKKLPPERR